MVGQERRRPFCFDQRSDNDKVIVMKLRKNVMCGEVAEVSKCVTQNACVHVSR